MLNWSNVQCCRKLVNIVLLGVVRRSIMMTVHECTVINSTLYCYVHSGECAQFHEWYEWEAAIAFEEEDITG